jgi:YebC/PmpR family DNA-binding regulatory protein
MLKSNQDLDFKGSVKMSGHSKWKNIMHKKGKTDAQKAKIFTKIAKEMAVVIKEGGADPTTNTKLKDLIAKAKFNNVPNDNIERVIKKAQGGNDGKNYESIVYEGYGKGGIGVIVETLTDNKNRTAGEMRHYFDKYGAGLAAQGAVSWQFDKKGIIVISSEDTDEDNAMMISLELGALDFEMQEDSFEITTNPSDFQSIKDEIEKNGFKIEYAEIEMVAQNYITVSQEDYSYMEKLLEMLEDNDDVQNVWHNMENEAE